MKVFVSLRDALEIVHSAFPARRWEVSCESPRWNRGVKLAEARLCVRFFLDFGGGGEGEGSSVFSCQHGVGVFVFEEAFFFRVELQPGAEGQSGFGKIDIVGL